MYIDDIHIWATYARFQRLTRRLKLQTRRFKRKQTRENVGGLCLDANRCNACVISEISVTLSLVINGNGLGSV